MERALESLSVQHEATELVQSEVEEVHRCCPLGSERSQQPILICAACEKKARLADMAARGVILGSGARRCKWRSARCLAIFASQSKRGNVTWHGEGKSWSI